MTKPSYDSSYIEDILFGTTTKLSMLLNKLVTSEKIILMSRLTLKQQQQETSKMLGWHVKKVYKQGTYKALSINVFMLQLH